MKKPSISSLILGLSMVLISVFTLLIKPTIKSNIHLQTIDLDAMIPREFGNWKIDGSSSTMMVDPDLQGTIHGIYDQSLSRTYINDQGQRVMLSIAYGRDQSTDLQIHRPEICYAVSGFKINRLNKTFIDTSVGAIPVMQMVATRMSRREPVTYWIRVGDTLTAGWLGQKLATFKYLIKGIVPDGLLFRISNISENEQESFKIQQLFLSGLLTAIPDKSRNVLVGELIN